jgi:predicted Zn-dependent peptidase
MKTRKQGDHIKLHLINGYKVLFVKQPNTNQLHIECVIRSGFYNESKELSGINHLLEHMMVEGWKQCKLSCSRYWDNKGYYTNASTDKTTMNYYIKGLNHEWKNMITYITSIINKPVLTKTMMEKEKQAVIDELLTFSTEPNTDLLDTFNKEFYKIYGLKHSDDWQLQIDNLKNIGVDHVYTMFDSYFNNTNMMFVVLGDFNERDVYLTFKHRLKTSTVKPSLNFVDCYTYNHDIIFTKKNIENTKIFIGFPYSKSINHIYIHFIKSVLHTLLFDEMRTRKSIVYDIAVLYEINLCGTSLYIEFDVQTKHAKYALKTLFAFIEKIKDMTITNFEGLKNKEIYDYMTDENSIMDYYTSLIYTDSPLYTKKQIIHLVQSITHSKFKKMLNDILQLKSALCVYESKQNLHLSWKN